MPEKMKQRIQKNIANGDEKGAQNHEQSIKHEITKQCEKLEKEVLPRE